MGFLVECLLGILILVVLFVCLLYVCIPLPYGLETTFGMRLIFGMVKLFTLKVCINTLIS